MKKKKNWSARWIDIYLYIHIKWIMLEWGIYGGLYHDKLQSLRK